MDSPLEPPEGTISAHALISNFLPLEWLQSTFLLLFATQFVVLCYRNSRKLIQTPETNVRDLLG